MISLVTIIGESKNCDGLLVANLCENRLEKDFCVDSKDGYGIIHVNINIDKCDD